MTKHLLVALFAILMLASCSPSASKKAAEIEKLANELKESGKENVGKNADDNKKLKELMSDYQYYVRTFPADSLTPIYLMMEGKLYTHFLLPDSAIYCYDQVYTRFPTYLNANEALFREAYILNNEKHDFARAKTLYQEYLSKYPNTPRAKSVQQELHFLGKTPDQIMAEIDSVKQTHKDTVLRRP